MPFEEFRPRPVKRDPPKQDTPEVAPLPAEPTAPPPKVPKDAHKTSRSIGLVPTVSLQDGMTVHDVARLMFGNNG